MADIKIKITGMDEIKKALSNMSQDFKAKNTVGAAYTACKPFQDGAIANIDAAGLVDTGALRRSIQRKKVVYDNGNIVVIITGVSKNTRDRDKYGNPRIPNRYAPILEPRYNFMQNSFLTNKQVVVDTFARLMLARLKKYQNNPTKPTST